MYQLINNNKMKSMSETNEMNKMNNMNPLKRKIQQLNGQYNLDNRNAKISAISSKDIDKCELLTDDHLGIRPTIIDQAKSEYSPLGNVFNKGLINNNEGILKKLDNINDKLNDTNNLFIKSKIDKDKDIDSDTSLDTDVDDYDEDIGDPKFKEGEKYGSDSDNDTKDEVPDLEDKNIYKDISYEQLKDIITKLKNKYEEVDKKIDRNLLELKKLKEQGNSFNFSKFSRPSKLINNIENGHLEKETNNQIDFQNLFYEVLDYQKTRMSKMNNEKKDELKNKNKNNDPETIIKNIDTLREARINIINDFINLTEKEQLHTGKGLKVLSKNQMTTRLPILIAQIKAGNNSVELKNELRLIIYLLYRNNQLSKNMYNDLMNMSTDDLKNNFKSMNKMKSMNEMNKMNKNK